MKQARLKQARNVCRGVHALALDSTEEPRISLAALMAKRTGGVRPQIVSQVHALRSRARREQRIERTRAASFREFFVRRFVVRTPYTLSFSQRPFFATQPPLASCSHSGRPVDALALAPGAAPSLLCTARTGALLSPRAARSRRLARGDAALVPRAPRLGGAAAAAARTARPRAHAKQRGAASAAGVRRHACGERGRSAAVAVAAAD
eukprot:5849925-Pleurochrysis_carterae.AAC.3